MKQFLIQLTILSSAVALAIALWNNSAAEELRLNALWLILLFFFLLTLVIHYILLRSGKEKPEHFIRNFMGTTAVKFLIYLIVLLTYCFLVKFRIRVFLFGFLIHYFIFTVFEVYSLLKKSN